ncbi:MAG: sulfur carrier protein ThiS adenylyltransferase ThiF [Candidatus Nanoarchaeia archaeon]
MNIFEKGLSAYFSAEIINKIQSVRIGIAGAGGLGSNCAMNLVRSGFKMFRICDFDKVEPSNLNRQFYFIDQIGKNKVDALSENLKKINPDLNIEMLQIRVEPGNIRTIFENCDIVVEAFDCAESKKMLAETYAGKVKMYVTVSGIAGWGNTNSIITRKISDCIYIISDGFSGTEISLPPCSPRVNVAAAKQADLILSAVIGYFQK